MAKPPKNPSTPAPLPQSGGCFEIVDGTLREVAAGDAQPVDPAPVSPTPEPAETTPSTEA